jgi:transposase
MTGRLLASGAAYTNRCSRSCEQRTRPTSREPLSNRYRFAPLGRPNRTDRERTGFRHRIGIDAATLDANLVDANSHDVAQLLSLIGAIPSISGLRGHPLSRRRVVCADRGYDFERHRRAWRNRIIEPAIAKRRIEHGSGLGKFRWAVERPHAWLHHFRRLCICFKRRASIHGAFLKIDCYLICWSTFRRAGQPYETVSKRR